MDICISDWYYPPNKGKSISTSLWNRLEEDLLANGINRIYCEIAQNNTLSLNVHEKKGFKKLCEYIPEYVEGYGIIWGLYTKKIGND